VEPHSDQHLPGPSVWPVGFALGVVCLLVGIVVSWIVAAVGAAIALVFAFLWVRDLAKRRGLTDVEGGPAEQSTVAEIAAGPASPGGEPGERFPRSVFLEGATLGLSVVIGGLVTAPALGFMVLPAFLDQKLPDVDLGPLENFPENEFVVATFMADKSQGEVSRRTAFVRYNGLLESQPSFTIISNHCAHLGCPVQPSGPLFEDQKKEVGDVTLIPAQPAGGFACPCHGGAYDQEGNRTAGPPVRALDRYSYSIVNAHLVLGKPFSVGKVTGTGKDAVLTKYPWTNPGEHVDGIEGWLYPIQPPRG
jgi:menaquinol-cytochrome c reductase iron-sulfur subunit